ncbi:MAG: NAD(+) synthase [Selenomonadaceae bacterium]|nr:NAD(+) synthase [Selenomonadaceae bacterium]
MKIAAGHSDINAAKILRYIDEARTAGAKAIIFPKSAIAGQMIGDTCRQKSFLRECISYGEEIAAAARDLTVVFGNINLDGENIFCVARDGIISEIAEGEISCAGVDVKLISEPFSITKDFSCTVDGRPLIRVGSIGLQNTGKTVYTFDGASAVFNSRGEVVQCVEPFTEAINFIETDDIDKMPVVTSVDEDEPTKIYRAVSFGVKNFLEQIGMKKVVIGVSGGIDSAITSALYTKILGAENVLLVNMPSVYNSATTRNLSEQLAKNLGCKYCVVPIQESVNWTVKQLESTTITLLGDGSTEQIKLSGFVRENVQARDRSSRILAALSAAIGGGFTCNANKAETSVGYATLYGDEAGFLCAFADIWKFQVYALANYMNDKIYGREVIPQGIIDIVPSAELSDAQNVDEGKGDPLKYDYHDYLLRAFAERDLTPEDILNWYAADAVEKNIGCADGLVKKYFATAEDFITDLERWWKQFTGMGVVKRIQSPPLLAVTDKPYGARRESQNLCHFTRAYLELKDKLTR